MARVFLVNPPSPEPVRSPLLSFCHLAASLRQRGHEVALYDASTPLAPRSADEIARRIGAFAPDLVGLHLKTLHVQPAYALAAALGERWPLVAGGPHATVCPDEPLARGFRYVVRGEGEETLPDLADAVDGRRRHDAIAGLSYRDRGLARHNPERGFLTDLDALAPPMSALDLFDPVWYADYRRRPASEEPGADYRRRPASEEPGADYRLRPASEEPGADYRLRPASEEPGAAAARALPPAGLLSSRGCPAACTFCANNVTGRRFRYRSAASVASEIALLRDRFGLRAFSFFDDSFAVGHRRVAELCEALAAVGPVYWTCTAHPAHLDPPTLRAMKRAGCTGVDLGLESGDPGMLLRIGKGVTVERVLDVLGWCRDLGLSAMVNLMFGWPDETDAELGATLDFMERAAPLASGFNARGVLVPYPGTGIYDRHHARFGFTEWWIREAPIAYAPFPTEWSAAEVTRAYASDAALARNFFGHPPHRLRLIEAALARKAELTLGKALSGARA